MSGEQSALAWYQNPTNWFIALGIGGAALLWWFASGQPGVPLQDGDYSCEHIRARESGAVTLLPPGATVSNGKVVEVLRSDLGGATSQVSDWGNIEKKGTHTFRVTITFGDGDSARYECTLID